MEGAVGSSKPIQPLEGLRTPPRRPRTAVIYHFFPHYRKAVVESLARSTRVDFEFVGDTCEYLHSVEPAELSDTVVFHRARCRYLGAKIMWQWGAVAWAARPGFDTVVFHSVPHWPCTWIGALLARLMGRRVLFWGHGYLYPPKGIKGLVRRAFYALPHAHLVYGRNARMLAIAAGWDESRVYAVYNSLDLALQRRVRESVSDQQALELRVKLFGRHDIPVVACPTRLIAARGLGLLLEALAKIQEGGAEVALLLIGDGPERGDLEQRCLQLRLRAHFEGACYDEWRIGALLRTANVTVAPGKVGLTALHSMTYGVPVVTHGEAEQQMPEWETVIPGKTGALFERGSLESLVGAILPWLGSGLTSLETRAHCHQIVERLWNPETQTRIIEDAVLGLPPSDLPAVSHVPPRDL
jgi:glycosyltransferase involved in cell wall biosynthesis